MKGSLILSLFSTLVLIGLFAYLNHYTQRDYFKMWTAAWGFYAVWIIGWLYLIQFKDKEHLEWLKLFALGACALFLLMGTLKFSGRSLGKFELGLMLLLVVFSIVFIVLDQPLSRYWLSIVFFGYLAMTSWVTAAFYYRRRVQERYIGAWLMMVGFLLWGFQMLAYPLSELNAFFKSTVFVTASAIQLEMAVAMIILVLEETRQETNYLRAQMKTNMRDSKTLRRKVQITEIKYSNLFDRASDAIFICDPTTLGVEDANRSAERLTGFSREELKQLTLHKLCPWLRDKEKEIIQDPAKLPALVEGIGSLPVERKDGSMIYAEGYASVIKNNGSSTIELFLREVTEQKQLEQKLRQAEKLSALGQLISGVAHELNNPLSVIVGYSQLLAQRSDVDEKMKNDLLKMQHESERAARIVKNFLAFARKHSSEKRNVNIHDVINTCLELRAYELKVSGVTVQKDFDKDISGCFADTNQLEQVFLNLINNAIQAMDGFEKKTIRIATELKDSTIQVRIRDNGRGIPKEFLGRIFDPFFTTKKEGDGTGLGLSISYSIIRAHSGNLYANNNPDGGACFIVELPAEGKIVGEEEKIGNLPVCNKLKDLPSHYRVLVVDDEVSIHDLFFEFLPEEKFDLESAYNGQTALDLLQFKDFDLIICDLKMSPIDGRVLFEKIIQSKPHLRSCFLFVTGDTNTSETLKFLDCCGAGWIAKPFRLAELENIISRRLNQLQEVS